MSALTKCGPYCPTAPRSAKLGHLWPSPDQEWHRDSSYNLQQGDAGKDPMERTQLFRFQSEKLF